jgi:hypothetical protein
VNKFCRMCGGYKPEHEFFTNDKRGYLRSYCKACDNRRRAVRQAKQTMRRQFAKKLGALLSDYCD